MSASVQPAALVRRVVGYRVIDMRTGTVVRDYTTMRRAYEHACMQGGDLEVVRMYHDEVRS